tara:strand:- start:1778 stop:2110 length:333 start_codon:yes stop_codon:yes gene_type:complete
MEKFLFFENTTAQMVCIPAHRLVEMEMDGSETNLDMRFRLTNNSSVGSNLEYTTEVIVDNSKGEEVMKTISHAINSGKNPFIVIADDVNKEYISPDINQTDGVGEPASIN